MEILKKIDGFEYYISNLGNVYSYSKGKLKKKKVYKNSSGYLRVELYRNSKNTKMFIHRLVAIYFIKNNNPDVCKIVNHKDENKCNNTKDNLEWCTKSYNSKYNDLAKKRAEKYKKSIIQYDLNMNVIKIWDSQLQAAQEKGFSQGCISKCCLKERKTHKGFIWRFCNE